MSEFSKKQNIKGKVCEVCVYLGQRWRIWQHPCVHGNRAEREPWSSTEQRSRLSLCHRCRLRRRWRHFLVGYLQLWVPCWLLKTGEYIQCYSNQDKCWLIRFKRLNVMFCSQSVRGMEMMTPLPVPIHRRLHDTMRAVMRTNEKPSLPVPDSEIRSQS